VRANEPESTSSNGRVKRAKNQQKERIQAIIARTLERMPITGEERLPANESEMSSNAVSYAEEEDKR
jgi:hypothetical protein